MTLLWRYPFGISEAQMNSHIFLFGTIGLVWILFYYSFGLLNLKSYKHFIDLIYALIGANFLALVTATVFFYIQPTLIITPRRFLLVDIFLIFVLSFLWQSFIRWISINTHKQTVYLIDLKNEYTEYKKEFEDSTNGMSIHSISHTELLDLTEKTHRLHQTSLFIVPSKSNYSTETLQLFAHLHSHGATFIRFDDFYEQTFRRVFTTSINDWWLLEHTHRDHFGIYPVLKRLLDIIFAVIIAIVFLLSFPFIVLLIKIFDPGTIFFAQTRLSINGIPFTIFKYRTMKTGTQNNTWTKNNDPRVTRIGKFLRTTRLDELPQCINILRGDMSLIGPRPEQAGIVKLLKEEIPYFESRHAIRPGLTGWAQLHIYAGNTEETKQKLQYDLYYLKHRSILFDLEIILKTISHLFFLKGT